MKARITIIKSGKAYEYQIRDGHGSLRAAVLVAGKRSEAIAHAEAHARRLGLDVA